MASGVLLTRFTPLALMLLVGGCASSPPVLKVPPTRPEGTLSAPEAPARPIDARLDNSEEEFLPPPPPDPPVPADSLANRLLDVALVEAREAIAQYNRVVVLALENRPDAQNRARQKVLEAALAAERAETLMRVRFALLGGIPNPAEGEFRQYLSFMSIAGDDLMEVDAIDGNAFFDNLEQLTLPIRNAMKQIEQPTVPE